MVAVLFGGIAGAASASIVSYTNSEAWSAAAGTPVTSIFFTEIDFETGGPTIVNTQYAALGAIFGNHYLDESCQLYPSDCRGLSASVNGIGTITVDFTSYRTSVAVDHKGAMRIDLFAGEDFLGSSIQSWAPASSAAFVGVVSTLPFDRIVIRNPASGVPILDNLHFGAPIPAPAGFALLGLCAIAHDRRRRTS